MDSEMKKLIYIFLPVIFLALGAPKCTEKQDNPCQLWLDYVKQNWRFDNKKRQYTIPDSIVRLSEFTAFIYFDYLLNKGIKSKCFVGYPKKDLIKLLGKPSSGNKSDVIYLYGCLNMRNETGINYTLFRTIRIDTISSENIVLVNRYISDTDDEIQIK